jgi:hemerythrin-like domain-containing protein
VKDVFTRLRKDGSLSDDDVKSMLSEVRNDLRKHMSYEEDTFYPAARKKTDMDREVDHYYSEHQQLRDMVESLAGLEKGSSDWTATLDQILGALDQHVQDEETKMFLAVQNHVGRDEAETMAADYRARS